MKQYQEVTIWDAVTPKAIGSSTDATPVVVTATSHGYSTGDKVIINGHATNIAANGIFKITVVSSSTFSLQDINTGANIAGSGAGAGTATGIVALAPKIVLVEDFLNVVLQVNTSGSANFTLKLAGSIGKSRVNVSAQHGDTPNFGATQTVANPYSFIQAINLATAAAIDGATGVTSAGTDIHNLYEVNVNGVKYLTIVPTAWAVGAITIKAMLYSNE